VRRGRAALATASLLLGLTLVGAAPALHAQASCDPARADTLVEAGWTHWRAEDVARAEAAFRAGVQACAAAQHGWTGLGYVALRRGAVALAIARFDSAFAARATYDLDAVIGLGLATFRAGQLARARRAFVLADSLAPGDSLVRGYLGRLPAAVDADDLPPRERPRERVQPARVGRRILEVPDGRGGWRPFWVKAVNLGAALPGKHPSEFPPDDGTYDRWIRDLAELGANSVRVYTIHPPHFYRALRDWNLTHPDSAVWLIHGVWTELPPGAKEENYDDLHWNAAFLAEMGRVVDLVHGHAAITPRPGHASGLYTADVSSWTLGYIIGREWEPYSVQAFAAKHRTRTQFTGRYLQVAHGNAVDVWLATVADSMIAYEMTRWNTQRPLAYTNWPTLDPLSHPTESSRAEEAAWLARRRERVPEASREYDNDVIALDATKMRATPAYTAGLFASYHAYPYYPDFLVLDPGYATARTDEGPSNYVGYLRELVAYHGDIPVVISEYGVPSSRGNAHLQPQGWHHGGHDEAAQAAINARLTRDIAVSGAAGAGIFALIDEWFKKNWLVIDFERPAERNRLWLNALDAEQHYGLIAMRPGARDSAITVDGTRDDWAGRTPLYVRASGASDVAPARRLDAFWVHADEAYLYLRLDVGAVDFAAARYLVGIDSYDARLGDSRLPHSGTASPVGLEFVLDLAAPEAARLLVDRPYAPYREAPIRGSQPPLTQSVYNRPFRTRANADGLYDSVFVTPNRRTIGRDGRVYAAQRLERNLLRHARQDESTLADWFADRNTRSIEVRIPWGMLHVLDPSSHQVLFGATRDGMPDARSTDGFRFVVQSLDPLAPTASTGERLPSAPSGFTQPPTWRWSAWDAPRWWPERKPAFAAMRDAFSAIPDSGPPR
jgi:tetratricopeptide (TPR) repeat protein